MLNFQARVGIITRTLAEASGDLGHFLVVFLIITIGYALVGHVLFGHTVASFSTIGQSISVCAQILLGEIGVLEELSSNDFWFAPVMFFWSYIFVGFFVMTNVLLAIIIDSYAIVKMKADSTTPMSTELLKLAKCQQQNTRKK